MSPDVSAPANDTIAERNGRLAAHELAHLESRSTLLVHIEPAAIALGREEHTVVARDRLGEVRIELDHRPTALELRRAEILEPMLRALHAMQHALRSVGKGHHGVLHGRRKRAGDDGVAREEAGKGVWVRSLPDHAGVAGGEAEETHERVRRADYAGSRGRRADDARGGRDIHA